MQKILTEISCGELIDKISILEIKIKKIKNVHINNIKEIKTVCHCGGKATMVVRINSNGAIVSEGTQIEVGGNESYIPLCRKHFNSKELD